MNLGDFSDEPCLQDPTSCSLTVSVWLKIHRSTNHRTFILGNSYNDTKVRGFSVAVHGYKLTGYVLGSKKYCNFQNYNFHAGYWFHFTLSWPPSDKYHLTYKDRYKSGKFGCESRLHKVSGIPFVTNTVYAMGVDESLAGNANQYFDVAFDELAIWYFQMSESEIAAFINLARGNAVLT